MKIKSLISLATVALLVTACSNENEGLVSPSKGMLRATVEGNSVSTRVGFDSSGSFYWSTTDKLGVTTSEASTQFTALDLKDGGGTASATFEGNISGTIGDYAVYPCNDGHGVSGTTLTYNFPATYTYTKVDRDYFTDVQGEGNSFNPAMWGRIASGSVSLKHLGGVFCIKVPKMPVAAGTLSFIADKKITGSFTANLSEDTPVVTSTESASEGNTVSITFSGATVGQPGVFYVPVPTGTYTVRVKILADDAEKMNVAAGTFEITRRKAKMLVFSTTEIDADASTKVEKLSEATNALKISGSSTTKAAAVTVSSEISSTSNEITVPAVATTSGETTEETSMSVSLEKVASGASLTVTDAKTKTSESTESTESVSNFTLSIPSNEAADFTPLNVEVAMPNTTVTLTGNAGAATYGTITASTADNTLVIDKNVTVKKVIVKKGNVRVNKGAELVAIEKSTDFSGTGKVTIYKEEGATLQEGLSLDDFEVVDVVDVAVADMNKVLAKGGTYTLQQDMVGDFVVSATAEVTINLNGHKVTNKSGDTFTVNLGSTLNINGNGTVDNVSHGKACVFNNGTVTLNGGTYTRSKENGQSKEDAGGNSYYNILNHGIMTINAGVKVEQSGHFSSMIANGYYDYSDKNNQRIGYVNGVNKADPSMEIKGGTFSGGLNTVKNDDGAKLNIWDGTFKNVSQAVVQNHHVTYIKGGTFSCSDSKYVVDNEGHNDAVLDLGNMYISGGTFTGTLHNVGTGADLKISGGTFSDPAALQYLGEEANVKVSLVADASTAGFKTNDGQTVEIDMNRHTLTLENPTVGSTGTETNSCQLLMGSKVTFRNGTLTSQNKNIIIQNYSELLLEAMTLNTPNASYSISNNNGSCTLTDVTIDAAEGGCAFDVYSFDSYEGVTVTVNSGTINGKVEFGGNNEKKNIKLVVKGGTFNGDLVVNSNYYNSENSNIIVSKDATFGDGITSWNAYIKEGE